MVGKGNNKKNENDAPNVDALLEKIKSSEKETDEKNSDVTLEPAFPKKKKVKKPEHDIPRGKPKSGRPWKEVKQKFASIKKSVNRRPFHKKMEFREEMKHIKELSRSVIADRKAQNELKKERRLENAERRLANERKAEVVQIIKNPAKLKKMRRKQLRMVEKRDLDKIKVV